MSTPVFSKHGRRMHFLILTGVLLLSTLPGLGAQVLFEYSHVEGDRWHLTSEVDEDVLVDGVFFYNAEILNRIAVEVLEGEGGDGRLWNRYQIAELSVDSDVYAWSGEFEAEYGRNTRGRLSGLPAGSTVPTVRDIPVFPDTAVEIGESWRASGTEVFDLEPGHGIPEVLEIDFQADYQYMGPVVQDDKELEKVLIEYGYTWTPDAVTLGRLHRYAIYPVEITGEFYQEVLWDGPAGRNYAEQGRFSYTYFMSDGRSYTFRGSSRGKAVYAEPMNKEALIQEIEDLDRDDIRAIAVNEGVKVSLEDINFVPDEAVMLSGQEGKLSGILEILSRYPDRDIQVVGHTARIRGLGDGQVLSEERAETVARYIIDAGVRSRDRIVTRGMGNREPIGDNSTELGRRRNRRVEIVILEN